MLLDETKVMVAVAEHWLVGSIPCYGNRIQDILKDESTNLLRLSDVQICQDADLTRPLISLPHVIVPKQNIELMVLPEGKHEAPVKRWNNLAVRATTNVFAIMSRYCVRGELQLPESPSDTARVLTHQLGTFFPITQASIVGAGIKLTAPVLFANKRLVHCLYVGDAANVDNGCSEAAPAHCEA